MKVTLDHQEMMDEEIMHVEKTGQNEREAMWRHLRHVAVESATDVGGTVTIVYGGTRELSWNEDVRNLIGEKDRFERR